MEDVVKRGPDPAFWRGKRVLLTGHTASHEPLKPVWLHRLGAAVTGVALAPTARPDLFELARVAELCTSRILDIRDAEALRREIGQAQPEVVLHLAAQSLVRAGYRDPLGTYATNVMGTANLLEELWQAGRAPWKTW